MDVIFTNTLIFSNLILVYLVRDLYKSNKRKNQIIRLQEKLLKQKETNKD
jgi:hypothetical protein